MKNAGGFVMRTGGFGIALLAMWGCGAARPDENVGSSEERNVCGTNDMQSVGNYVDQEGVDRSFIDAHQGPVGKVLTELGSGTLIGDGLFLTARHLNAKAGYTIHLNYQLDANNEPLVGTDYPVTEVVETGGAPADYAILRLPFSPENLFGSTGLAATAPPTTSQIICIGHPFQPGGTVYLNPNPALSYGTTWKVADVGTVSALANGNVYLRSIDFRGVGSGSGVLDTTGRLVGIFDWSTVDGKNWFGSDCSSTNDAVQAAALSIETVYAHSSVIQGNRGSGHFFQVPSTATATSPLTQIPTSTSSWDSDWTQIAPGNFNTDTQADLFFYSANRGQGRIYNLTSTGGLQALGSIISMSQTWSQIIPIEMTGASPQELLFYDAQGGSGAFYSTDGFGHLSLIKTQTNWSHSWRVITAGNFSTRAGSELLFYSPDNGMYLYGVNSDGGIVRLNNYNISDDPSIIVPFSTGSGLDEVLMYSPSGTSGTTNIYSFNNDGTLNLLSSSTTSGAVTQIVTGNFTSGEFPSADPAFIYYTPSAGQATIYSAASGSLVQVAQQSGLRANFGKMLSGNFRYGNVDEVMFYDRFRRGD